MAKVQDDQLEFTRFRKELEFLQCLCNVDYLHCTFHSVLAHAQFFDDPDFLRFLDYLAYWRRPEYSRFVM
jgi:mediator of RNA polymerase II transcription subunit 31